MDGTCRKTGIYRPRFQWWFPWNLTDWWKPRVFLGGDEWSNTSACAVIPPLGGFALFRPFGALRTLPCPDEWDAMDDEQRADYAPCGYYHGGRIRRGGHLHGETGLCDEARAWLLARADAAAVPEGGAEDRAPVSAVPVTCPRCGSPVVYDLTCHTWSQTQAGGAVRWMGCMPCDSAIRYMCDGPDSGEGYPDEGCGWEYTHGLNPRNPRAAANEENRPPWLPGKRDGDYVAPGVRLLGEDRVSP